MVLTVTDANIKELMADSKPLVVDCWAEWCGPCKMMLPVVDELAKDYEGRINIGKLNVDENPETCERFGVMNIPTMLMFKNGELVNRHVGYAPKARVAPALDELL